MLEKFSVENIRSIAQLLKKLTNEELTIVDTNSRKKQCRHGNMQLCDLLAFL